MTFIQALAAVLYAISMLGCMAIVFLTSVISLCEGFDGNSHWWKRILWLVLCVVCLSLLAWGNSHDFWHDNVIQFIQNL